MNPMIDKLFVSDFDDTLFRSPYPPDGWDESIYWWELPESLGPPCCPERPGAGWWNQRVVQAARQALRDPTQYCIVLTGRRTKEANFLSRIPEILESNELYFDEVRLSPTVATGRWKLSVMQRLARQFDVNEVEIWDDRADHLELFRVGLPRYAVVTHHVQEPKRQCRGFRFRGHHYVVKESL